jgi:hypothetical protein
VPAVAGPNRVVEATGVLEAALRGLCGGAAAGRGLAAVGPQPALLVNAASFLAIAAAAGAMRVRWPPRPQAEGKRMHPFEGVRLLRSDRVLRVTPGPGAHREGLSQGAGEHSLERLDCCSVLGGTPTSARSDGTVGAACAGPCGRPAAEAPRPPRAPARRRSRSRVSRAPLGTRDLREPPVSTPRSEPGYRSPAIASVCTGGGSVLLLVQRGRLGPDHRHARVPHERGHDVGAGRDACSKRGAALDRRRTRMPIRLRQCVHFHTLGNRARR